MLKFVSAVILFTSSWSISPDKTDVAKEAGFRQVYARENITLHERPIVNRYGVDVREVKAVFTARSSSAVVVEMLRNADKGMQWNIGAGAYDVLNNEKHTWVTYIEYDLPWPLNDHDAVLRHSLVEKGNIIEVAIESVEDVLPLKKGAERMEQVQGKWTIRSLGFDVVEISYQVSTKPSAVPRLITDPIVHYQMTKSMSALRELLEQTTI
ncbi:MAG: hypothetical protein RIF36_07040 [Imperialibacter sp.]|uniref:hypothetical protein n=1 Tax=Imperialibacter sp. TaxID=2038411 RepID=UPI0032EE520C